MDVGERLPCCIPATPHGVAVRGIPGGCPRRGGDHCPSRESTGRDRRRRALVIEREFVELLRRDTRRRRRTRRPGASWRLGRVPTGVVPALTSAARNGYAVETDVRWTSDNTAVIVHDEAARKGLVCTRPVRVSQTTWSELSKVCQSTPGPKDKKQYPISTSPRCDGGVGRDTWILGLRRGEGGSDLPTTAEILAAIRGNGLSQRTVVTSFNPDYLRAIHAAAPDLRLMLFTRRRIPVGELEKEHLWAVAVKSPVASKTYVGDLQHAGLIVVDWPLNEAGAWATGESVGADKVLTDYPNAYSEWLGQR